MSQDNDVLADVAGRTVLLQLYEHERGLMLESWVEVESGTGLAAMQRVLDLNGPIGGAQLFLSASERLVVVHVWSGNSESCFRVLTVSGLRIIGASVWLRGEGARFAIAEDDSRVVMAQLRVAACWWLEWEGGRDVAGVWSFPVGDLCVYDVLGESVAVRELVAHVPVTWEPPEEDGRVASIVPLLAGDVLQVTGPWGAEARDVVIDEQEACVVLG